MVQSEAWKSVADWQCMLPRHTDLISGLPCALLEPTTYFLSTEAHPVTSKQLVPTGSLTLINEPFRDRFRS